MSQTTEVLVAAGNATKIAQFISMSKKGEVLVLFQKTKNGTRVTLPGVKTDGYHPKNKLKEKFIHHHNVHMGDKMGEFTDADVSADVYFLKSEIDPDWVTGNKIQKAEYVFPQDILNGEHKGIINPITYAVLEQLLHNN